MRRSKSKLLRAWRWPLSKSLRLKPGWPSIRRSKSCREIGAGGYGEAATRALPHATQVTNYWHLMKNTSMAVLDAVRKSMRSTRATLGTIGKRRSNEG